MQQTQMGQDSPNAASSQRRNDGTITGRIVLNRPTGDAGDLGSSGTLLRVSVPLQLPSSTTFGRYFLARCVPIGAPDELEARKREWSIYARLPLFSMGPPTSVPGYDETMWDLLLPAHGPSPQSPTKPVNPGYAWLARLPEQAGINLIGPLGRSFDFAPRHRTLVVVADTAALPLTLPAMHDMLDRGGRVALVWIVSEAPTAGVLTRLPIQVEVRMAHTPAEWEGHLAELLRWGDCLCAALTPQPSRGVHLSLDYHTLAHTIRTHRYHLEPGYAQALLSADLVCGYGACLACVVPTPDGGQTRACLHGPLFPLEDIAP